MAAGGSPVMPRDMAVFLENLTATGEVQVRMVQNGQNIVLLMKPIGEGQEARELPVAGWVHHEERLFLRDHRLIRNNRAFRKRLGYTQVDGHWIAVRLEDCYRTESLSKITTQDLRNNNVVEDWLSQIPRDKHGNRCGICRDFTHHNRRQCPFHVERDPEQDWVSSEECQQLLQCMKASVAVKQDSSAAAKLRGAPLDVLLYSNPERSFDALERCNSLLSGGCTGAVVLPKIASDSKQLVWYQLEYKDVPSFTIELTQVEPGTEITPIAATITAAIPPTIATCSQDHQGCMGPKCSLLQALAVELESLLTREAATGEVKLLQAKITGPFFTGIGLDIAQTCRWHLFPFTSKARPEIRNQVVGYLARTVDAVILATDRSNSKTVGNHAGLNTAIFSELRELVHVSGIWPRHLVPVLTQIGPNEHLLPQQSQHQRQIADDTLAVWESRAHVHPSDAKATDTVKTFEAELQADDVDGAVDNIANNAVSWYVGAGRNKAGDSIAVPLANFQAAAESAIRLMRARRLTNLYFFAGLRRVRLAGQQSPSSVPHDSPCAPAWKAALGTVLQNLLDACASWYNEPVQRTRMALSRCLRSTMLGLEQFVTNHCEDCDLGHEDTLDSFMSLLFGCQGPHDELATIVRTTAARDPPISRAECGGIIQEILALWLFDPETGGSVQAIAAALQSLTGIDALALLQNVLGVDPFDHLRATCPTVRNMEVHSLAFQLTAQFRPDGAIAAPRADVPVQQRSVRKEEMKLIWNPRASLGDTSPPQRLVTEASLLAATTAIGVSTGPLPSTVAPAVASAFAVIHEDQKDAPESVCVTVTGDASRIVFCTRPVQRSTALPQPKPDQPTVCMMVLNLLRFPSNQTARRHFPNFALSQTAGGKRLSPHEASNLVVISVISRDIHDAGVHTIGPHNYETMVVDTGLLQHGLVIPVCLQAAAFLKYSYVVIVPDNTRRMWYTSPTGQVLTEPSATSTSFQRPILSCAMQLETLPLVCLPELVVAVRQASFEFNVLEKLPCVIALPALCSAAGTVRKDFAKQQARALNPKLMVQAAETCTLLIPWMISHILLADNAKALTVLAGVCAALIPDSADNWKTVADFCTAQLAAAQAVPADAPLRSRALESPEDLGLQCKALTLLVEHLTPAVLSHPQAPVWLKNLQNLAVVWMKAFRLVRAARTPAILLARRGGPRPTGAREPRFTWVSKTSEHPAQAACAVFHVDEALARVQPPSAALRDAWAEIPFDAVQSPGRAPRIGTPTAPLVHVQRYYAAIDSSLQEFADVCGATTSPVGFCRAFQCETKQVWQS